MFLKCHTKVIGWQLLGCSTAKPVVPSHTFPTGTHKTCRCVKQKLSLRRVSLIREFQHVKLTGLAPEREVTIRTELWCDSFQSPGLSWSVFCLNVAG